MGLDIVVYLDVVHCPSVVLRSEADFYGFVFQKSGRRAPRAQYLENPLKYDNGRFSNRCAEFQSYDIQAVFKCSESYGFRAGSYGSYGAWRHELAQIAGFQSAHDLWTDEDLNAPFVELINFSDCEGSLGAAVCAKLAQDFEQFKEQATLKWADNPWSHQVYGNFHKAFKQAGERNGLVQFC